MATEGDLMEMTLDDLKRQAATLSAEQRAELALALIESLDSAVDDLDEAGRAELSRRPGEIASGAVRPVSGDDDTGRLRRGATGQTMPSGEPPGANRPPDQDPVTGPPGFAQLSKDEQIQYVQDLWDRISDDDDGIPVPEWHLAIAEERLAEYERNPSHTRPAFEVLDELARSKR